MVSINQKFPSKYIFWKLVASPCCSKSFFLYLCVSLFHIRHRSRCIRYGFPGVSCDIFWWITAPKPKEKMSAEILVRATGLYRASTEGFTSSSLMAWNESSWLGPQIQEFLLLTRSIRGWVNSVILCVNLANWLIMPMKYLNSEIFVGACILTIAAIFSRSGLMLSLSIKWPRNLAFLLQKMHFTGFSVTPTFSSLHKTAYNLVSCSLWSLPNINTSSIEQSTPSNPQRIFDIRFWKCSGAVEIPKASLLKQ